MNTSFVQKVNLKLVKKGRKYWSCVQHWEGHGKKRDYTVKMLINDSNKALEPDTELTDYLVEVQKKTSGYRTERLLVPIDIEQYQEERAESIYNAIKTKWENESFIPSAGDVKYANEQKEELANLGKGNYIDEIDELIRLGVIRRNIKFIRKQFADDMYINEKRIDNLHHLGCFDYDDEIRTMREKKEEAKKAKREVKKAERKRWLETHFTRNISADTEPKPKIGSMTVISDKDENGEITYRAGKCTSCRFVSDEDNVWGYGDIYYAEYDDISATEDGQKLIQGYKAQKLAEKQEREKAKKLRKALRELERSIKEHNQLTESRVNLSLDDLTVLFDDQSIYGGGETVAVDPVKKQVWYIIHHHMDGDDWSANNIYFSKASADGFGDAIGYMTSSEECQSLIDEIAELGK